MLKADGNFLDVFGQDFSLTRGVHGSFLINGDGDMERKLELKIWCEPAE